MKEALHLPFKQTKFAPGLLPSAGGMVFQPTFTSDILEALTKRTLSSEEYSVFDF